MGSHPEYEKGLAGLLERLLMVPYEDVDTQEHNVPVHGN